MPRDTEWMGQDLPTPLDLAIFADLLTPTLVVRIDAVRRNIARMCAATGSIDRLRVHIKSAKLRVVFDEFLAAGITHFKCATTREAAQLLAASEARGIAVDLLVAFPHRGPNLRRIEALARLHPRSRLSVLVETEDDIEGIEGDASMAAALGVFVDIDAGMNRTGIPSADAARIESVAKAAASRLRGLHFYEGHVHSGSFADRCSQAFPLYDELVTLVAKLEGSGLRI
ncbi:MAG TPA: alanine racemase, partial [Planctomycetota bacterium]|nr:alanine racemase [Planctomycetota bacterium]